MTDLLLLTHDTDSTTGTTIEWCRSRNVTFEVHASERYFAKDHPHNFAGLMIFGGDMEAWEIEKYPWLVREKKLIRDFIEKKKPVTGICLGAQLVAEQLGGEITDQGFWELGWYPVQLANGEQLIPLHCHSSKFSLPEGAKRIATDSTDVNQGFYAEPRIVGFQFHTEIDSRRIERITSQLGDTAVGRKQSKSEVLDGFAKYGEALKKWYFAELDRWWITRAGN